MAEQGNQAEAAAVAVRVLGYPESPVRVSGMLEVGDGHQLYWEDSGRSDGIPVLFLHGGPGAGTSPFHRRFFNPHIYRIILFDQRGSGHSLPYASTENNTTAHLVADIEVLRQALNVEQWVVFGGSWGSTLALAYGQAYPQRVLGFILRGVFLCRQREVDWFIHGMGRFRPEAYADFLAELSPEEQKTPLESYYRRLCDPDPDIHGPAAYRWASYEDACARLAGVSPSRSSGIALRNERGQSVFLAIARLEAHYLLNQGFMPEAALLQGIDAVAHLPCTIVQGRYDLVCPPESAWDVHRKWPGSSLVMIPDAGHSALEPGIRQALQDATAAMATRVQRSGAVLGP